MDYSLLFYKKLQYSVKILRTVASGGAHGFKNRTGERTGKGGGSRISGQTGGRTGDVINNLINYINK